MLDLNVFVDLESSYERSEYLESGALAGDWLADQVDLVISSELSAEIGRHPDACGEGKAAPGRRQYLTVRTDDQALDATARRITDLVLKAAEPTCPPTWVTFRTCGIWQRHGFREPR